MSQDFSLLNSWNIQVPSGNVKNCDNGVKIVSANSKPPPPPAPVQYSRGNSMKSILQPDFITPEKNSHQFRTFRRMNKNSLQKEKNAVQSLQHVRIRTKGDTKGTKMAESLLALDPNYVFRPTYVSQPPWSNSYTKDFLATSKSTSTNIPLTGYTGNIKNITALPSENIDSEKYDFHSSEKPADDPTQLADQVKLELKKLSLVNSGKLSDVEVNKLLAFRKKVEKEEQRRKELNEASIQHDKVLKEKTLESNIEQFEKKNLKEQAEKLQNKIDKNKQLEKQKRLKYLSAANQRYQVAASPTKTKREQVCERRLPQRIIQMENWKKDLAGQVSQKHFIEKEIQKGAKALEECCSRNLHEPKQINQKEAISRSKAHTYTEALRKKILLKYKYKRMSPIV